MSARTATIDQLLHLERELEPVFEPHARISIKRSIVVALALVALFTVVFGHATIARGAHAACTIGEPAGATCSEALVHVGYP